MALSKRAKRQTVVVEGLTSGIEGLHENEPAQHEAMVNFPNAGHTSKIGGDESGQISKGDHHGQSYPRMIDTKIG